jgi:hypothetical protein
MRLPNDIRLFIFGVLGACVVAVIVTIIVVASSHRRPPEVKVERPDLASTLSSLDLSNFQIPESYTEVWKQKWYPSRAQEKQWTWEEVQRFWRDPRKSALNSITAENDAKMNELFKGVK